MAGDGGREFTHTTMRDGDEVDLGGLTLRALATPGHTFEHLSYLLLDGVPSRRGVHRRLAAGRCRRADRSGRGGPHRGADASPVPLPATARVAARRHRGLSDARRGVVLLGPDPAPSAPQPSAANWPPTRCSPSPTRTSSSGCCWDRWAATRRTSCGCREMNRRGPSLYDGPPIPPGRLTVAAGARAARPAGRGRRRPLARGLRRRSPAGLAVDPAAPGVRDLAGLARPTGPARSCSSATPTRTRTRSSGSASRSATTTSSAS